LARISGGRTTKIKSKAKGKVQKAKGKVEERGVVTWCARPSSMYEAS
jgi:hypothetical protein